MTSQKKRELEEEWLAMTPEEAQRRWFILADSLLQEAVSEPLPTFETIRLGQKIEKHCQKAVAEEREACAKVADEQNQWIGDAIRKRV